MQYANPRTSDSAGGTNAGRQYSQFALSTRLTASAYRNKDYPMRAYPICSGSPVVYAGIAMRWDAQFTEIYARSRRLAIKIQRNLILEVPGAVIFDSTPNVEDYFICNRGGRNQFEPGHWFLPKCQCR
jgi:hypothetical protein